MKSSSCIFPWSYTQDGFDPGLKQLELRETELCWTSLSKNHNSTMSWGQVIQSKSNLYRTLLRLHLWKKGKESNTSERALRIGLKATGSIHFRYFLASSQLQIQLGTCNQIESSGSGTYGTVMEAVLIYFVRCCPCSTVTNSRREQELQLKGTGAYHSLPEGIPQGSDGHQDSSYIISTWVQIWTTHFQ